MKRLKFAPTGAAFTHYRSVIVMVVLVCGLSFILASCVPRALAAVATAILNLTWLYAEAAVESEAPLLPPQMEELALLSRLVNEGRIHKIRAQATRLEKLDEAYAPLARRLQALAKGFEIDRIKVLLVQFIKEG